jgi:citrate lyase subunit beta/citryl-CoA lyase
MPNRSWLIVPGDSEQKLDKALASGADVIVVDLEASVAFPGKDRARRLAAEWLGIHARKVAETRPMARWVRINSLTSRCWRDDLSAAMSGAPDGIILADAANAESVRQLAAELYELEEINRIPAGSTRIIPQLGETPQAAMMIGEFVSSALPRLTGLSWNAQSLAMAISARRTHEPRQGWCDAFRFVRAQVLLAAHAQGIVAIETPHANFADEKGTSLAARDARADGFTGMFAIHPGQIESINAAFAPNAEELDEARRIVAAFEDNIDGGVVEIDRRSIDQRQFKVAKRMLEHSDQRSDAMTETPHAPILRPA